MEENPGIDVLLCGGESVDLVKDPRNRTPHHYQWYPASARLARDHEFVTMNGLGMLIRRASLALTGLYDPRHLHADTSFLTQATVRGAKMAYLRVKCYRHLVGPQSMSLHNVRKTYIYRDFHFKGLSRLRYLKKPGEALAWLGRRAGILKPGWRGPEPAWDATLIY
jgi:hypothetical protein